MTPMKFRNVFATPRKAEAKKATSSATKQLSRKRAAAAVADPKVLAYLNAIVKAQS